MSDTIKWSELTPSQRNDLIHEKVMGHDRQSATRTCKTRAGDSFSYTVTFWQTGGPDIPRYTTSLDAIKPLRQRMTERSSLLNLHLIVYAYNRCYASFSLEAPVDDREWSEGNGEHCMEEAICKAALRACNVEVEA
jgi:hypothetical protein